VIFTWYCVERDINNMSDAECLVIIVALMTEEQRKTLCKKLRMKEWYEKAGHVYTHENLLQ